MQAEHRPGAVAVVVSCLYSGGDPADAEVLVYSPAEPGRAFQRLRTDMRGLASFVPDTQGTWRVVADDGTGHRAEVEVTVTDGQVTSLSVGRPRWPAAVGALALVAAALLARRLRRPGRGAGSDR